MLTSLRPQHFTVFNDFISITNRSNQTKYNENTYVLIFRFLLCSKKIEVDESLIAEYLSSHMYSDRGAKKKLAEVTEIFVKNEDSKEWGKKLMC